MTVNEDKDVVVVDRDHLPECPQFCDGKPPKCHGGDCTLCDEVDCICPALRACEERVWDEAYANGYNHGTAHGELHACSLSYEHGYKQGVQAARDAVLAYADERLVATKHPNMSEDITTALRVAAKRIDALKEKP